MNKILCNNESIIDIKCDVDSIMNIGKEYSIEKLNIEIKDNVKLIINHYNEIEDKINLKVNVTQNNNSEFVYNHSFMNKKNYNLNIFIDMLGNNSKNTININGISDNGISNITIDGKVFDNTIDNELSESVRMLNINEGKSNILPNMYINTKNVIANHAASVTNISENYLFYLNSKGIENDNAKDLIINGFLLNDAR